MTLRTLCFLLCSLVLLAPARAEEQLLRLHGSNTIGAKLAPSLIEQWLAQRGARDIQRSESNGGLEKRLVGHFDVDKRIIVEIEAHGSGTGFKGLASRRADIAMASRRIKDKEHRSLSARGDLRSAAAEHVIGLDGIAVLVHPGNPLAHIDKPVLAEVFAGKLRSWRSLGGDPASIAVHARDENSGTWDTFKSLVLGKKNPLIPSARRYASNDELSDEVAGADHAIGFAGFASVRSARPLPVAESGVRPIAPNRFSVATEDYPLARRLYMYTAPDAPNPLADDFLRFTKSDAGQRVVEEVGFVAQAIDSFTPSDLSVYPDEMRSLLDTAERLSLNVRFEAGSVKLDNKALDDVRRIAEFMQRAENRKRKLMLFGFADAHESLPLYSLGMSTDRADQVAKALIDLGVRPLRVRGYGMASAVASNDAPAGRMKNRRVEIWIL